ncbi:MULTISPECIES: ABC transporter permease [unclassified Rathayibacter]|uniref:ABC transporter permease n=1 Tax=unclassified Rathayibacter TaxID=2609250 RepID=UPI00188CDD6D|nr:MULTISPECIES: ABC transporter permease [unclassified Rathayibacter]MBF4463004.1 ABC transporter permease [Rathayibacter sp. VKM Ac-2879]MBF4504418.1 ABC transporter permease [Rathayibacter sp. VKM Ac-2878]
MTLTSIDRVRLDRRVPPLGGFNATYLRIELMRKLRNRRTLFFTLLFPVMMYFIVGYAQRDQPLTDTPLAAGGPSVAAFIMVSMAMYGTMMSATQTGAAVAVERAQGWSRQLRLTPLNPFVNVLIKMIAGMMLGLVAVVATYIAGAATGIQLTPVQWIVTGLTGWLLSAAVFTTLGLMIGYLVPGENAAQITSLLVVVLAFLGGLFYPVSMMPDFMQGLASLTPVYGISELARSPLTGDGFDLGALANAVVWLGVFLTGTVIFFRRDTKRV